MRADHLVRAIFAADYCDECKDHSSYMTPEKLTPQTLRRIGR